MSENWDEPGLRNNDGEPDDCGWEGRRFEPRATDKIVIVGAACRFPGSESLEAYWENLLAGRNCASPATRWPHTLSGDRPVLGGFLNDVAQFDAPFFRISPNEARCMDPQQRILLEVVHHAIEDCGLPAATLRELRCGVFCTSLPGDYKFLMAQAPELAFSSQSFLGNATASLSGRISYFYDFNGPSITLDTACSSSLTALQIACLQLQSGQCGAAVVGAVSVFSTSELFEFAQRTGMLSAQGRCAAFGEHADGFVPSEGAATIVLTTQHRAAELGLEVLATIEAIALNHDGQSNGLMAPNARAQGELIASMYSRAGLSAARVGYVEAHGTGTKLGDPIELAGLVQAYRGSDASYRAYLGASKSVIGHTLVCSGLASVLKAMLVLRHGCIPPHPIEGPINGELDLDRFVINRQSVAWPSDKELAAVSAFGFTGSNGHVVLGRAIPRTTADFSSPGALPFLFSAQSQATLRAKLAQFLPLVRDLPACHFGALSVALGKGTQLHRLRVAVSASTPAQLAMALEHLLAQETLGPACAEVSGLQEATTAAAVEQWLGGADVVLYAPTVVARTFHLPLPKYPFDRKAYWVATAPPATPAPVPPALDATAVLVRLQHKLAELLGFEPAEIDAARPLRDYGIDSISVIQLLAQFGPAGTQMQPHDIFDYPSLARLSQDLAQRGATTHGAVTPSTAALRPDMPSVAPVAAPALVRAPGLLQWQRTCTQGRPILLLPPLNMSEKAWIQQVGFLQRQGFAPRIAIYPGHLGNGADRPIDCDEIVAELIAELTRLGPAPLLGWSLGGCFSLALAARAPQWVSSMVLVSTAARFGDDIFGKTIDLHAELEAGADYLDIVLEPKRNVVEQVSAGATMETLSHYYRMLAGFDLASVLPRIAVRALVVQGSRDVVVNASDLDLLRRLPNSRVVEFPKQGHFVPLLAARAFNELLRGFLATELH